MENYLISGVAQSNAPNVPFDLKNELKSQNKHTELPRMLENQIVEGYISKDNLDQK